MYYAISDVHGCYDLFLRMLEKIGFSDDDTLYYLGDAVDRGPDGIPMLLDLMARKNVIALRGNHEDMMLGAAAGHGQRMSFPQRLAWRSNFINWTRYNGGDVTWEDFLALPEDRQQALVEFIRGLSLHEEITVGGRTFLLIHAGVGTYEQNKDLADCSLYDFIWERMDYDRVYYPDKYLVTGHTPTVLIDPACRGRIFRKNNHIVLDCGAVFAGTLGCICLDTLEEFYVQ